MCPLSQGLAVWQKFSAICGPHCHFMSSQTIPSPLCKDLHPPPRWKRALGGNSFKICHNQSLDLNPFHCDFYCHLVPSLWTLDSVLKIPLWQMRNFAGRVNLCTSTSDHFVKVWADKDTLFCGLGSSKASKKHWIKGNEAVALAALSWEPPIEGAIAPSWHLTYHYYLAKGRHNSDQTPQMKKKRQRIMVDRHSYNFCSSW